jgi:phospholipid/cholesterol/gamma-HCH transport system substrate-binding protein
VATRRQSSVLGRLSGVAGVVATVVVIAAVAAIVLALRPQQERMHLSVDFPRTVSVYEGSEVRILGVPVGRVEKVTPQGDTVRVDLWWDAQYDVPRDAQAAIVTPAVVGDRYVQLAPAYTNGPTMESGTHLDATRSAVPLELDEILQSVDDLSVALGPEGANADGSLSDLVDATADNLEGNGAKFRSTIRDLSLLSGTLSNNKDELFSSVSQVEEFVHALAVNDAAVREFNESLAEVSTVLAGERRDLALAVDSLAVALRDVRGFVEENGDALSENVKGLVRVTGVLVKQREALTEVLDVAPLALNNLANGYNERTGTLDQRMNVGENVAHLTSDPKAVICSLIEDKPGKGLCGGPLGDVLDLLDELQLQRTGPFRDGARYVEHEPHDASLAELMEVAP